MSPLEYEKQKTPNQARLELENAGLYAYDIGFQKVEEIIERGHLIGKHYFVALYRIAIGEKPQYISDVYDGVLKEYKLPPKSDNWDNK